MSERVERVAIAGGGIGGLTLAVGLHQRGIDAIVLERRAEIGVGGAGISLWPNALAALDTLALGDEVRDLGAPLAQGGLRTLSGRDGPTFTSGAFVKALGGHLLCVDRGELVRALVARLAPGSLRRSSTVMGYRRTGRSVDVRFTDGQVEQVAALVGADGMRSSIASQLNGGLTFRYTGYVAWRGIAETVHEVDRGQIRACFAGGREFGWMPVSDRRTYWFATSCVPEPSEAPEGDRAFLRKTFGPYPRPVSELLEHTPTRDVVRRAIVDRAAVHRWCEGPVTVLGDAAHPMRPHLGQGGCQAIEDAAALVAALGHHRSWIDVFDQYERSRRARAERAVRLSKRAGFTRPPGLVSTVVDQFIAHVPGFRLDRGLRLLRPIAGYAQGRHAVELG